MAEGNSNGWRLAAKLIENRKIGLISFVFSFIVIISAAVKFWYGVDTQAKHVQEKFATLEAKEDTLAKEVKRISDEMIELRVEMQYTGRSIEELKRRYEYNRAAQGFPYRREQ